MRGVPKGGQKDRQDEIGVGSLLNNLIIRIGLSNQMDWFVAGEYQNGGVV